MLHLLFQLLDIEMKDVKMSLTGTMDARKSRSSEYVLLPDITRVCEARKPRHRSLIHPPILTLMIHPSIHLSLH